MKSKIISILIVALVGLSCNQFDIKKSNQTITRNSLIGNWQLFDLSNNDTNKKYQEDNLLKAAQDKEIIKQGIVLSLFNDGTYTDIRGDGQYTFGKWQYDAEKKVLHFSNSSKFSTVPIKQETINSNQTIELLNYFKNEELKFIQINKSLNDFHEDPFYFKNNLWRIKPLAAETTKQLQQRLANYFKHLAYILKSAKERKQNVVSFQFSLGIVKIYNGGIGIYPLSIIPKTWMNTYYTDRDAISAYYMFSNYLTTHTYGGAGIGNWIEDDYNILLSIYGEAEQGKFASSSFNN